LIHSAYATRGIVKRCYTPRGGVFTMRTDPIPCRVQSRGRSLGITLTREVREQVPWRAGDFVAVRVCGEKLIIERVPLEGLAKIRTGEVQPYAANLIGGEPDGR
jgi:antitoxin component of MazEF toxin-antitoxin module